MAAARLIPQADVVALTGSALINHILDEMLSDCHPDSIVLILGPSTSLFLALFEHDATIISGTRVLDKQAVRHTVVTGANFRQIQGVQLVTLSKPGFVNRV